MKKKVLITLLVLLKIYLFSSSNQEITDSITHMGNGDGFLWETGSLKGMDSTSDVKSGESLEREILYLEKSFPQNVTIHKDTFILKESRRISIAVKSRTGAKITLIDRMSGVLSSSGDIKNHDGRIDIDLDRGEYQIKIENQLDDSPTVKVSGYYEVNNTHEQNFFLNSSPGEYLNLSLKDIEQRSFWVKADRDQPVIFEALGRNLNSLSIWKDGEWKVDASYNIKKREVEDGKPLNFIEFNNILPDGYYLFKLSGSQEISWAKDNKDSGNPLYVRTTPESFSSGEIKTIEISPFGNDAFFYRASNLFIGAPQKKSTISLKTSNYSVGRSRYNPNRTAKLDYESYDELCILKGGYSSEIGNLMIEGVPGTIVKIGTFISGGYDSINLNDKDGIKSYWINGFTPAGGEDSVDLTPLLHSKNKKLIKSGFIEVSPDKPMVRTYNLNNSIRYFINIKKSGTYVIQELGDDTNAKATFSVRNFRNYTESSQGDSFKSGETIKLNKGYYTLSVNPNKYGIHNFVFFSKPITAFTVKSLIRAAQKLNENSNDRKYSSFNWSKTTLEHIERSNTFSGSNYILEFNSNNEKVLNIRELPMDLSKDFIPLVLSSKESVEMEVIAQEKSEVVIYGDNYNLLDSKGKKVDSLLPGIHKLVLSNRGNNREIYSIGTKVISISAHNKRPQNNTLTDLLPKLTSGVTSFNDFNRDQTISYLLTVNKPSLYRLETTGRLRTTIKVRTPNITDLFSGTENGIGRNGLINTFLKPGEYLIEATTRGNSKGRAGILLKENDLILANELGVGDIHRAVVDRDSALKFPVTITENGEYEFSTLLFNSSSRLRLEDSDGWPIYISGSGASKFTRELDKGYYTYFSLPQNRSSRRVTSLKKLTDIPDNVMPLNGKTSGIWIENSTRKPNVYKFSLNTIQTGYINISSGFEGWITDENNREITRDKGGRIDFRLNRGDYYLNIRTVDVDNKKRYEIRSTTHELSENNIKTVSLPGEYKVSIGQNSIVDIWSSGTSEIEAYLYSGNKLLEYNNDAEGDWNFFLSNRLEKGIYRLVLKGSSRGQSKIFIKERKSGTPQIVELPLSREILLGNDVFTFDIKTKKETSPMVLKAMSTKDIFIYLYKGTEKIAWGVNSLNIPIGGEGYSVQFVQRSSKNVKVKILMEYPEFKEIDFNFKGNIGTKSVILENSRNLNYYITGKNLLYSSGADRIMTPISKMSVSTKDRFGYILSTSNSVGDISTTPLELKSGSGQTVDINTDLIGFKLNNPDKSITLVKSLSPGTTLGMELNNHGINWDQSWVSDSKSLLLISPEGDFSGTLWSGNKTPTKASLVSKTYPVSIETNIKGSSTFPITKGTAQRYNFSSGGYSVVTSRGVVASLWQENRLIKTYFGDLDDNSFVVPEGRYTLAVLNLTNRDGLINIQEGGNVISSNSVEKNIAYESYFTDTGHEIFQVSSSGGDERLHISGNLDSIKIYNNSGSYREILNPEYSFTADLKSGRVEVKHNGGLLRVWTGLDRSRDMDFATNDNPLSEKSLNPGSNRLDSDFLSWDINIKTPIFISLKTNSGGITSLLKNGELLDHSVGLYPEGRTLNYYLDSGDYTVVSRAFIGGNQSGELFYSKKTPVELFEGGLDRELFINRGESHIYSFNVVKSSKIGIGIKNNKDYLEATIYDSDFKIIKQGSLNYINLDEGQYFMIVDSHIDTVRYIPVVYGLNGSVQAIPESVIKKYR